MKHFLKLHVEGEPVLVQIREISSVSLDEHTRIDDDGEESDYKGTTVYFKGEAMAVIVDESVAEIESMLEAKGA